jgi:hypothetical protein
MRKYLTLCLMLAIPGVAVAQRSSSNVSVGVGFGLAAEGPRAGSDNAFSVDAHVGYTPWRAASVALGVDGSVWSAVDNNCDQACNGRTRAYGVAARGAFGFGAASRLQFGIGGGPFRVRYSKLALGGARDEVEHTVLGAIADVDYAPRVGRAVHPTFSLRGLLLPARNSTRAAFVSLGVGLSVP